MFKLRRIWLDSVGPPDARFDPLTVELTDAAGDPTDSVLWLINGGGKGVMLKLIFSVLRPDRVHLIGADRSHLKTGITPFVLASDTSYVALEWQAVDGRRVVTGAIFEWANRAISQDTSKLTKTWFSFTPRLSSLSFETLAEFAREDGRRVNRRGFLSRLRAYDDDQGLNIVIEEGRARWLQRLEALHLDPALYGYQLEMNKDEGGVEKLFQFKSDRDFVEFLVELTADAEQLDQVSANLAQLAAKFRDLPSSKLELAFVEGALRRLEPLAECELARREASTRRDAAAGDAAGALASFGARLNETKERHDTLEERVATLDEERKGHETARLTLSKQAAELRRRSAQFAVSAAEAALAAREQEATDAATRRDAWAASEIILACRSLEGERTELELESNRAELAATPLRERVQAAADALAARLTAELVAARDGVEVAREDAERAKTAAQEARDRGTDARLAQAAAKRDRSDAERALERIEADRETLRVAGAIGADQSAASALAQAEKELGAAEQRLDEIEALRGAAEEQLTALNQAETNRARKQDAAERRRTDLTAQRDELTELRRQLEADERLIALAEGPPNLALDGPELAGRLRAAAADAERSLVEQLAASAEDRTLLLALNDAERGLLPGGADLEQALRLLRQARIACTSGWRHLADALSAHERDQLLISRPELGGAVVLTDPASRERAEAVLAEASLAARTVVPVVTSDDLRDLGERELFIVPPSKALYDYSAAAESRAEIEWRLDQARTKEQEHTAERDQNCALVEQLSRFLSRDPFSRLADLGNQLAGVEAQLLELAAQAEGDQAQLTQKAGELRQLAAERNEVEGKLRLLAAQLPRFQQLAEAEETLEELHAQIEQAEASEREQTARIERAQAAAREADANYSNAVDLAADRRSSAERLAAGLAELAHEPTGPADHSVPVEELRRSYERQKALLERATSGSELAERLRGVGERLTEQLLLRQELPEPVVLLAEELVTSPDAADRSARRAALQRAERHVREAGAAVGKAGAELTATSKELEAAATIADRSGVALPVEPTDPAEAEQLRLEAEAGQQQAQAAATAAQKKLSELRQELTEAGLEIERLGNWCGTLSDALGERPAKTDAPRPFPGSIEQAGVRHETVLRELRAAAEQLRTAETAVEERTEDLRTFVLDAAYDSLSGPIRDRLGRDRADVIAAAAPQLHQKLKLRVLTLSNDIEEMGRDKQMAVSQLAGVVDDAIKNLRQAARLSRLPETLPDWGGQDFLRIQAHRPDSDEDLNARVSGIVDQIADGEVQLRGVELLVAALERVVGRDGFNTTILKPKAAGVERVSITEFSSKTSGGQGATAAILLYCTLLGLRARHHGINPEARAYTTLLLDNPFGKATASSLLRKQRAVAAAMGVQLVYLTGVSDFGAIAEFPNTVRLRNDAELRKNLRCVRIAEIHREQLLPPLNDGANAQVAAARSHRGDTEQLEFQP